MLDYSISTSYTKIVLIKQFLHFRHQCTSGFEAKIGNCREMHCRCFEKEWSKISGWLPQERHPSAGDCSAYSSQTGNISEK